MMPADQASSYSPAAALGAAPPGNGILRGSAVRGISRGEDQVKRGEVRRGEVRMKSGEVKWAVKIILVSFSETL